MSKPGPDPMLIPSLDVVASPPWGTVRGAMKMLRAVTEARTEKDAESRLERVLARAEKSAGFTNAAYVAAQVLRDADVLDRAEAIYLFTTLYDLWEEEYSETDAQYQACLQRYVAHETTPGHAAGQELTIDDLQRELREIGTTFEARFHRARGEVALAQLLLRDTAVVRDLAAVGEVSLVIDAGTADGAIPDQPDRARVGVICERIAALAAAETTRETLAMHHALYAELRGTDVASGMAAVRALREVGLVSFNESIGLLSDVLDPLVLAEIDADRECRRLQLRMDELKTAARLAGPVDEAIAEDPDLWARYEARTRVLLAMCLRRFGEHEAATLLIEQRDEFERCESEISVGAWGGPPG